jgi:hypothetical protein
MIFWDVTHCSYESHALLQWVTVWSAVLVRCTPSWGCGTSVWTVCATTCVRLVSSWAGLARGTSWGTQCRNIVTRQVWHMSNYRQHMSETVCQHILDFCIFKAVNWYEFLQHENWRELPIIWQYRIWTSIYRTWTSQWHLGKLLRRPSGTVCIENMRNGWQSTHGQRYAEGFFQEHSAKRTNKVLKLNRNNLRRVTELLVRHCHLKGHLFRLGLVNCTLWKMCHNK